MFEEKLSNNPLKMLPFNCGQLLIEGPDAWDFLQKMSTNDMRKLNQKHPIATVFTDHHGKIIDRALIFKLGENQFLLVTLHPSIKMLEDWLEKFHFTEDFSLTPTSKWHLAFSESEVTQQHLLGTSICLNEGLGYLYLLENNLPDLIKMSPQEWELMRIANFTPGYPSEISSSYMPQNVGLLQDMSFNKGCFIGQEVLAKAVNFQKRPFKLYGFKNLPKDLFESLKCGEHFSSKNFVGKITSVSPCYKKGSILALAVLKQKLTQLDPLEGLEKFLIW